MRLYQDLNPEFRSQITQEDLFTTHANDTEQMEYRPQNRWNSSTTSGTIAHLIQRNNTLTAELDIAAQATVLRKDSNNKVITNPDQLIRCSEYGDPDRNSDPHVRTISLPWIFYLTLTLLRLAQPSTALLVKNVSYRLLTLSGYIFTIFRKASLS